MARDRIPPGARILGGDGARFVPPARTSHVTDFNNSTADVICLTQQVLVTDGPEVEPVERDQVVGYAFRIKDELENHLYIYKFDQESLMVFQTSMGGFPNVGEYMPTDDEVMH